ncbi:Ter macrodomain-binding protein MatP [Enterovibrio norvegicus FF-33]|uniref:Macrodomain Ter protein n=1 Tax=Enterovibrio norvegicus FF-454 TaxID=1185651 RepID=A0A1E5CAJ0_9GAMM|nr:macrodomain Ter protein MatP [Enterovibrio norvegicus]OEE62202.1 Ter macrodomain-binding protein MatP [Enterovibrio norvegicus FF-454]OEE65787.1 Ter macrodomain-binding protein MatP [Enterovibrio norvegicus FF-33]OEE82277.1 Ter macrodomain-binding protein MatP [Enterovibrio norvegicus FF-162]
MKYQQLENLEAGWKWSYLVKKHKEGFNVSRYVDTSEIDVSIKSLLALEHEPTRVIEWIGEHMSPALDIKLKQAIRAKRKRHFNAEQEHTRKKSIDLDFRVWEKLSVKAQELDATLSDTIEYLIGEANRSQNANKKVDALKKDLNSLLDL